MKFTYHFRFSVIITMIICILPISFNCMLAQKEEIPITTSSEEALKLFLEGREKWENIEIAAAALLFDQAIQKDPEFAMAYLYRSQSGGGFNIFRQNLEKAVSLVDKVPEGEKHLILYSQAVADGDGAKQKEHLDQLLKLFPNDKRVQTLAGSYFQYVLDDRETAIKHLKKATDLDKKYAPAYNNLGYVQSALGNYEAAEEAFETYINLIPDNPNPYDSYAELLLKIGKYDESIEQYKKAFEKDPLFTSALAGVGNNYIFKGDYETARKYYNKMFDKAPNINGKISALIWKATSYVHEGSIEKALKTFEEYRALAEKEDLITNVILSYANQGFILTESGNPTEGMKYYEKASDLIKEAELSRPVKENYILNSIMWRCYVLTAKNEFDKAEADFEKCKQMVENRQNPGEERTLHSIYALREIKRGNYDKALEHFSKADTEDAFNWYYMAKAYEKKGDKENASKFYAKVANWNVNSLNLALVRQRAREKIQK